jgi:hypothetical protein
MRNIRSKIILAIVMLAGSAQAGTQEEIAHLLDFVAATPCEYDRNGSVHDGPEARDHINKKYKHYRKKVKTAEDFIKYSATRSMMSGTKYIIRCPGFADVFASDWLLDELKTFREVQQP